MTSWISAGLVCSAVSRNKIRILCSTIMSQYILKLARQRKPLVSLSSGEEKKNSSKIRPQDFRISLFDVLYFSATMTPFANQETY